MNKIVKEAYRMQDEYIGTLDEVDTSSLYTDFPYVEVGETCKLEDIWDGNGDVPQDSYSYKVTDEDWIDYVFDVVEEGENPLKTVIKISDIRLI